MKRKGFTLTELVIVIAVIAVLSAVLIPVFGGVIAQSKLSSDISLVNNMNKVLAMHDSDGSVNNVSDAVTALSEEKIYLENFKTSTANSYLYYVKDVQKRGRIVLADNQNNIVYPEDIQLDENVQLMSLSGDVPVSDDYEIVNSAVTINSGAQFAHLMGQIAAKKVNVNTITLDGDIDLQGAATSFGNLSKSLTITGTNNATLRGLRVDSYSVKPASGWNQGHPYAFGLIGTVGKNVNVVIENVTISDFVVGNSGTAHETGANHTGIISGRNNGSITLNNVNVKNCSVTGYQKVGAVVGCNWGDLALNAVTFENAVVTGATEVAKLVGAVIVNKSYHGSFLNFTVDENCNFDGITVAACSIEGAAKRYKGSEISFKSGTNFLNDNALYWLRTLNGTEQLCLFGSLTDEWYWYDTYTYYYLYSETKTDYQYPVMDGQEYSLNSLASGVSCNISEGRPTVKPEMPMTFECAFEHTDKYLYRVGNANTVNLGSLVKGGAGELSADNYIFDNLKSEEVAVDFEKIDANSNLLLTYTPSQTEGDWQNSTLKFSGTGAAKLNVNGCEFLIEVVNGKNVTAFSDIQGGQNNVLLNDIKIDADGKCSFTNTTLYGNGFTFDISGGIHAAKTQGVIVLTGGTLDNVKIVGDVYTTYAETFSNEYYNSAVAATGGNCVISNCYIANCHSPVRLIGGELTVENTTLYGGRLSNLEITSGSLTLRDVTTVNQPVTSNGTTVMGFGVFIYDYAQNVSINIDGTLTQYNWAKQSDKNYLPSSSSMQTGVNFAFGSSCTNFQKTYNGETYVNFGILNISSDVATSAIVNKPSDYDFASNNSAWVCTVTANSSTASNMFASGVPAYDQTTYSPTAQGAVKPVFSWNYPSEYTQSTNTINASFVQGEGSYTLDTNMLTATKHGISLPVSVAIDGEDYTGKQITFTQSRSCIITYTLSDNYNYYADVTKYAKTYTFTVLVEIAAMQPESKHADFVYTDGSGVKNVEIGGKKYVMPDVSATSTTIASVAVSGTTVYMPIVTVIYKNNSSDFNGYSPLFTAINIADYEGAKADGAKTTYNTSTTTLPSTWQKVSGNPYINGAASTTASPVTYSSYGLCYESKKGADISAANQNVCFSYTDNAGETYYYYIRYKFDAHTCPSSCLTGDTLITLANGTQKRVDSLTFADQVLVWDFFKGDYAVKNISILVNHGVNLYKVVYLSFSDGTLLKIIGDHGVFDYDLNKYLYLTADNATDYIGHRFVKQAQNAYQIVSLTGVSVKEEYTEAWSISSAESSNVFAQGLLTVAPPDLFYNWVTMGEKLQYDVEQFNKDVQTYGLYTYADFADYVTYEQYLAFNGAYLKIPVAKGIFTYEYIIELIKMYSQWM